MEALEELPIPLWVAKAPEGTALFANRAAREILGQGAVPDIGIEATPAAYGICDRQGRPYPVERLPFSRAFERGASVVVDDLALETPDGRRVFVRAFAAPVLDAAGAVTHVVVSFMDVTAEVKAVEQHRTVEEQLAFAVKHAPILLWMTDREGIVTVSEGAALKRLGFSPGELVGRSVFDVYRDDPYTTGFIRRTLAGETISTRYETPAVSFYVHVVPLRGANGEITGVMGVGTDITDTRHLERQVIQDDRVRAVGALAASVAHEINNPLTYVSANVDVAINELRRLDAGLRNGDDLRTTIAGARATIHKLLEFLDAARTGAQRVARITRELRTFARGDDDPGVTADVGEAVRTVLDLVAREVEARARVVVEVAPSLRVRLAEGQLVQVLLNLVMNASQALPAGDPTRQQIGVAAWRSGETVLIEVSDSGPGVPAGERERVFEPFVTTKPIGVGTGLGLFVCRNIVRAANGDIAVDDAPGGGALFRVSLPAAGPALKTNVREATPPPVSGRVLVVDDDRLVARGLASALEQAGCETRVVHDGREAIGILIADGGIDLAYCDLVMNGVTGADVHAAVAAAAPERLRKLVFITGGAFTPATRAFVAAHEDVVVHKPFDVVADARSRLARLRVG